MAIYDFLRGLVSKTQSTPEKWLESSVRVVTAGQHGAQKPSFNHQRAVDSCRSWAYAAATINAQAVASVPIRLYARPGKGKKLYKTRQVPRHQKQYLLGDGHGDARPSSGVLRKVADFGDDMEEVTESHPIIELLSSTNPFLNGFDMTVLRILYGELTGNAYMHPVIDEDTGLPAELWPLAPQFTEVIPDEDEFIKGYLYGISADRKQVFDRDEVIHFRRPNPGNLYYGLGKIEAAYGAVLSNQALHDMDLAMFQNSARPDYAVVVRGTPTSDQLDRFQEQVEQRLRGTRRDGNFIAVTGDVQFTPLNFPPKDIAGREEIVEEIAAVFGVPVTMLKANDPNLASARTGFAQWREGTVLPLLRMDEEELNQTLLPMFGLEDELCLAYDNPVPRDTQYELQERQTAVQGGWRTINEARLEEGREAFEDNEFADQPLINGQPLGASAQQPPGPGGGMPGMDLSSLFSEDGQPEEEEKDDNSPDAEAAAKFLKSVRDGTLQGYSAIKLLQGCGFSRQVAEKMVDAEAKANNIERTEDDLYDSKEQAAAVASLIGCRGVRSIDADGETKYCPCADEKDFNTLTGKCPEGECDGDHGGQPRPKALRLRHILDGAATQELTKSFGDWSVRFKATSDNCGTGAGGFKEDNTCATGSSAEESKYSLRGYRSITDEDLAEIERFKSLGLHKPWGTGEGVDYDYRQGSFRYGALEFEDQMQLASLYSDLDADGRRTLIETMGSVEVPTEFRRLEQVREQAAKSRLTGDKPLSQYQSEDQIVHNVLSRKIKGNDYRNIAIQESSTSGWINSLLQDAADAHYKKNAEYYESLGVEEFALRDSMVSRLYSELIPENKPLSEETKQFFDSRLTSIDYDNIGTKAKHEIIDGRYLDSIDGNPVFKVHPAIAAEAFDEMDEEYKEIAARSYNAAKKIQDSYRDERGNAKVLPVDQLENAVKRSIEIERHFAAKGVGVRVDPGMFLLRSDGQAIPGTERRDLAAGFQDVAALDMAIDLAQEQGHDLRGINIRIDRREDENTSVYKWESPAWTESMNTGGWWHNASGTLTLPSDRHQSGLEFGAQSVKDRREYGVTGGLGDLGVAVHELGHAIHSAKMKWAGERYMAEKTKSELGKNFFPRSEMYDEAEFGRLGEFAWVGYRNTISDNISTYAASMPSEFVAETYTLKTMYPNRWDQVKDIIARDDKTTVKWPSGEAENLDADFYTTMTIGELYESLGGP